MSNDSRMPQEFRRTIGAMEYFRKKNWVKLTLFGKAAYVIYEVMFDKNNLDNSLIEIATAAYSIGQTKGKNEAFNGLEESTEKLILFLCEGFGLEFITRSNDGNLEFRESKDHQATYTFKGNDAPSCLRELIRLTKQDAYDEGREHGFAAGASHIQKSIKDLLDITDYSPPIG